MEAFDPYRIFRRLSTLLWQCASPPALPPSAKDPVPPHGTHVAGAQHRGHHRESAGTYRWLEFRRCAGAPTSAKDAECVLRIGRTSPMGGLRVVQGAPRIGSLSIGFSGIEIC